MAGFLALIVLQAVLLKEMHQLLEHHHADKAHCLALPGEIHIHSEEYAPADCSICFFHFAPADLRCEFFSCLFSVFQARENVIIHQNPPSQVSHNPIWLRGPPVFCI
jgi:hypothetical protein